MKILTLTALLLFLLGAYPVANAQTITSGQVSKMDCAAAYGVNEDILFEAQQINDFKRLNEVQNKLFNESIEKFELDDYNSPEWKARWRDYKMIKNGLQRNPVVFGEVYAACMVIYPW